MFLAPVPGFNLTIGSAEVELIKKSEALKFLSQRQSEISLKKSALSNAWYQANKEYEEAVIQEGNSQRECDSAIMALAVDANFIAASNEVELAKSYYDDFKQRYQSWQVANSRSANRIYINQAAHQQALAVQRTGQIMSDTLIKLRRNQEALANQLSSMIYSNKSYYTRLEGPNAQNVFTLRASVKKAREEREKYPDENDYLAGFNPNKLDASITSSEGDFKLKVKSNAMVFAKVTEGQDTLYWLVDAPRSDHKLILSNQNMLKISDVISLASQ